MENTENFEPRISMGKLENGVLTIDESFEELDAESLEGYNHLRKIIFPASLKELGSYVICDQEDLENVDFSKVTRLKEIPDEFISGKTCLKELIIPQGVTTLGHSFLGECEAGVNVFVPQSVKEIGYISSSENKDINVYLFAPNLDINDLADDIKTLYVLPAHYGYYANQLKEIDSEVYLRKIPDALVSIYGNFNTEAKTASKSQQEEPIPEPHPIIEPVVEQKNEIEPQLTPAHQKKEAVITDNNDRTMFSKELESLIQATLEDGVLEENEKAALVKRAEREGVDIAELEIYINSLLQKRAREVENEKNAVRKQVEKEKKEAFGRKCPNCGAQVPPLALKCECGYEFTTAKSVSSVHILSDKIDTIMSETYKSAPNTDAYKEEITQRYQRVKEVINMFPVPNTKEDIIEFLSTATTNSKIRGGFLWGTKLGRVIILLVAWSIVIIFSLSFIVGFGGYGIVRIMLYAACLVPSTALFKIDSQLFLTNEIARAWRAKFDQVIMKARSLRGDSDFTQQLDYFEGIIKK